ncbi:hypothetical protein KIN20_031929 [Parelaphostrongylus tenuis]|uniref:Secreted protein n=1 Tax=Parelaphostrongylus tenuis TaxID=148309 RepID=A0AAD5R5W0_PARTN|nr:hypothetical protein KIN20_031929 [Parelaphostrongylus tenuis]
MATLLLDPLVFSLLATISTVLGCGVVPAGQVRTRTFTVTGFTTLPVQMVYAANAALSTQVSGIASDSAGAQGFIKRLVMQTVFDVLERQGRSALLPDALITGILGQLEVKVTYEPMGCQTALGPTDIITKISAMPQNCIVVGSTVTGICPKIHDQTEESKDMNVITPIPGNQTSITGTITTTNVIMANWSNMMWQSILNRALRMLASGPFGSHFFSAIATVGGN